MSESFFGKLFISPKSAALSRSTDWFKKMDPYVVVRIGKQVKKSRTHKNGGKEPSWTDTLEFDLMGEQAADIYIYDEDVGDDDFVCQA